MVYFLDELESKNLLKSLRPKARQVGVTEELRGWNWDTSPLKPYHDVSLPMYLICAGYCPTSRDVYLNKVKGMKGEYTHPVTMGVIIHDTVGQAFREAKLKKFDADFSSWYESMDYEKRLSGNFEEIRRCAKMVWNFILSAAKARFESCLVTQPYGSPEELILTTIPFLVEHRISGRLLGTSGMLSVDCFDYMRNIIFDLKVGFKGDRYRCRIYPTGYALVFESVYEVPVDIGCNVFINFKGERMIVEKDLFHINDDLRSWWIEERDNKAEIVYEEKDPGIPPSCPDDCIYRSVCGE